MAGEVTFGTKKMKIERADRVSVRLNCDVNLKWHMICQYSRQYAVLNKIYAIPREFLVRTATERLSERFQSERTYTNDASYLIRYITFTLKQTSVT